MWEEVVVTYVLRSGLLFFNSYKEVEESHGTHSELCLMDEISHWFLYYLSIF
jgi:hypothetical protein